MILGGCELDGIDHGDGQVIGIADCESEELVVRREHGVRVHAFGCGEVERIEAFETEAVKLYAPLLNRLS